MGWRRCSVDAALAVRRLHVGVVMEDVGVDVMGVAELAVDVLVHETEMEMWRWMWMHVQLYSLHVLQCACSVMF